MPGVAASPTFDFRTGGSGPSLQADRELTLNSLKGGYRSRIADQFESSGRKSAHDRSGLDRLAPQPLGTRDDRYASQPLGTREERLSGHLGSKEGRYSSQQLGLSDGRYSNLNDSKFNSQDGRYSSQHEGRYSSLADRSNLSDRYSNERQGASRLDRQNTHADRSDISLNRGDSTLSDHSRLDSKLSKKDSELRKNRKHKEIPTKDEDYEDEDDSKRLKTSLNSKQVKKKKRKNPITVNLSGTRYDVIRQVSDTLGYTIGRDDDPYCYLIWNDAFVSTDRISELKPYQRINHFPGMGEICRKDSLARNMAKMSKRYPDDYNFVPKTWIFPSEYGAFQNYARELKKKKVPTATLR